MSTQFVNDGVARSFLNAGTSEGAKLAWETRGVGPASLRADHQSKIASEVERSGDHEKAIHEHETAATLHHAAASEAESKGDYRQQEYHRATEKFHRSR